MASNTLLISFDYLKNNSSIPNNLDNQLLQPIIILVQDKFVEPILGSQLYSRIVSDIQTNSLSGNYQTLVETYLQPTIVQYCIAEGLEQIASQITNIGVVNKNTDNSETAEESRITKLERLALNNGNFYAERCIKYLRANYTLFPELNPTNADCSTIFPVSDSFFSGISIPPYIIYSPRNDSRDYYI